MGRTGFLRNRLSQQDVMGHTSLFFHWRLSGRWISGSFINGFCRPRGVFQQKLTKIVMKLGEVVTGQNHIEWLCGQRVGSAVWTPAVGSPCPAAITLRSLSFCWGQTDVAVPFPIFFIAQVHVPSCLLPVRSPGWLGVVCCFLP